MLQQPLLLASLPSAVVDMTTDFAPLFMGMVIGLFLCVLAFAFAIGAYDSWRPPLSATHPADRSASESELPDAA
jgi:hypothetical protein